MISSLNNIQFSNIKLNTHEQISWVILIIAAIILLWLYISFFKRVKLMRSLRKEIETAKNKLITLKKEISNNTHEKWILEEGYLNIKKNAVAELRKIEKAKSEFNKFTDKINKLQLEIKNKEEFISTLDNDIASKEIIVNELFNKSRELDAIILYKTEVFTEEVCTIYEPSIPDTPVTSTSHSNMELMGIDPLAEDYIKRIGYSPNTDFQNNCYPAVYMPTANSAIKFPRKGERGIKGAAEERFMLSVKEYFNLQLQIFDDRILLIANNSRPYEPDITLQNEKNGLNLFIDIEIDEPYDGYSRVATHYAGQDDYRNRYFTNRGWMVIRFSEKQVVTNAVGCCRLIADVIKSVDKKYRLPDRLLDVNAVENESFWTKSEAEQWAINNIREKYLRIDNFDNRSFDANNRNQNLILTDAEKQADNEVKEESHPEPVSGKYNERNRHPRDLEIQFYPGPHIYKIRGNHLYTSVSTLIDMFFPFDREGAALHVANTRGITVEDALQEFENAKTLGTQLHGCIHSFLQSDGMEIPDIEPENQPAFNQFMLFREEHLANKTIYRTEWAIYDEDAGIAGTCDLVVKNEDGTFTLYDWKRTRGIWRTGFQGQIGIGICADMQNCNFNKYSLQLNMYKRILEVKYNITISQLYIVQFYPHEQPYELIPAAELPERTTELFTFAKQNPIK